MDTSALQPSRKTQARSIGKMISLRLFSIDFMHHASFNISQSVKVLFLFFRVACVLCTWLQVFCVKCMHMPYCLTSCNFPKQFSYSCWSLKYWKYQIGWYCSFKPCPWDLWGCFYYCNFFIRWREKKKISLCFWPKTDWQLCCICSMLPNTELNEGCWAQTRFLTLF